ncbi:MAG: hypothetical protein RL685_6673 [Pseudomonadota bacterium]|jgi:signal transduction histidine kinase/CheY-like chemotaxis protein
MQEAGPIATGETSRQSRERERVLGGILWAGALLLSGLIVLSPVYDKLDTALYSYGPGVALHLGHLWWLRRQTGGRSAPVRRVAISHCLSYLCWVTAVLALQVGGLRAPAAAVYPPLVLMAGLVWSGPAALAMALSCSVAGALLVWLEAAGQLPPGEIVTPLRLLTVLITCLLVTAVMIRYALQIIERTTTEALASEQQHAEQRRKLEDELREAQRIEALGRLAGGIAHDFNNLLTVIMGYAGMLPRESSEVCEAADAIELASQRARTLTHQLLAFGRRQVLRPEVLDLSQVLLELESLARGLLSEEIRLELALATEPCLARVDRSQLGQVVINLVANARDAMSQGGLLTLSTGLGKPPDYAGETQLPEHDVWLAVRDTGSGIRDELRSRIFEPFFTTKAPASGTGLGLATVHGIVTQSGGLVVVESTPGRGTRFVVSLPRAPEGARAPSPSSSSALASAPSSRNVLVVDDDAALRDVMQGVLSKAGYRVCMCADASSALARLTAQAGDFDLLISDVVMFGTGGPELARQARARLPDLPVLFVSGHAPELVDQRGAFDAGTEFLAKPFGAEELLKKVAETLANAPLRRPARGSP